ncbi:hypothetical protein D3C81_2011020 [compost metagenome]
MLFGGEDDLFEVFAGHVDELANLFQGLVQVAGIDADPSFGRGVEGAVQILRGGRALRITHAGQVVVEQGHAQQAHGIEHDRVDDVHAHFAQAGIGQHQAQGQRSTRRV